MGRQHSFVTVGLILVHTSTMDANTQWMLVWFTRTSWFLFFCAKPSHWGSSICTLVFFPFCDTRGSLRCSTAITPSLKFDWAWFCDEGARTHDLRRTRDFAKKGQESHILPFCHLFLLTNNLSVWGGKPVIHAQPSCRYTFLCRHTQTDVIFIELRENRFFTLSRPRWALTHRGDVLRWSKL